MTLKSDALEVALDAMSRSAIFIRRVREDLGQDDVHVKNDESPVTIADLASQALTRLHLEELVTQPHVGPLQAWPCVLAVLLVLLLVTFSGTNGAIQTGLSLALAVLRGALIYVYLPFNAMLSNVRELVTASSHVVIFAMPLLAMYTPLMNWRLVSEYMIIVNLGATMFALALQILAALAALYYMAAAACASARSRVGAGLGVQRLHRRWRPTGGRLHTRLSTVAEEVQGLRRGAAWGGGRVRGAPASEARWGRRRGGAHRLRGRVRARIVGGFLS